MGVFATQTQAEILQAIRADSPTSDVIQQVISDHKTRARHMLNLRRRLMLEPATNWSQGQDPIDADGVPIMGRTIGGGSPVKINHRLAHRFHNRIVSTFVAYAGNDISVLIDEDAATDDQEALLRGFERLNDEPTKRAQLATSAVNEGIGYSLLYVDDDGQARSMIVASWESVVVRDPMTDEPQRGLRYWEIEDRSGEDAITRTRAEWYDQAAVSYWVTDNDGNFVADNRVSGLEDGEVVAGNSQPHGYDGVPLIEWPKNPRRTGDVELTLTLQDAYDVATSDLSSEVAQMRLSYLLLKSMGLNIDDEFVRVIQQTGILALDANGEAKFVEKNLNASAIMGLVEMLKSNIFLFSNSVDWAKVSSETRIMGLEMKLKPLDESATETELMFRESLRRQYGMLADFWARNGVGVIDPLTLDFRFTRNAPRSITEEVDNFVKTDGLLSLETRLARLSFVGDVAAEVERIALEKTERLAMLPDFGPTDDEDEEEAETAEAIAAI